tara:strand:- start:1376 stop:3949 length:2574 start_codon:yes stop_codon:yes gene_type:complete
MEESRNHQKKSKHVSKVKTFPVPFHFKIINESFSDSFNIPSRFSKEQVLNQAFKLHSVGNTQEASKTYQDYIDQGGNDPRVFSNYGIILKDLGKLQEAELAQRKAIEINPGFANAHCNLGLVLIKLGRLKEAELSTRKAIELNPEFIAAHVNLGGILKDLKRLKEAELSTRKAIELNPDLSYAHALLGDILKELGQYQEAKFSLRKAIEINPKLANAYSNLGLIYKDLGEYKKAAELISKAIEINPRFAIAYSNLGIILKEMGKLEEAEVAQSKAIEINPSFAIAYSNLGNLLKESGKLLEAEAAQRKAIEINPEFANAHYNLANILKDLGKFEEALNYYLKALTIKQDIPNLYIKISDFLQDNDLAKLNKKNLKSLFNLLLERNDISHINLFNVFNFLYKQELIDTLSELDSDKSQLESLVSNRIIINSLKKIIFQDPALEDNLIMLRAKICNNIDKYINQIELIIGLAEQCFLNEYVYSISKEEQIAIKELINISKKGSINEIHISIIACYYPLYTIIDQVPLIKSYNSSIPSFNKLLRTQIKEPLEELELTKKIKKLGSIKDIISQKVKSQYEENPYPRWRYGSHPKKLSIRNAINNEIKPNCINHVCTNKKIKVLVAGCGTGNQILQTQRYMNAHITGIDLSLSSLSYAQRKINEIGIDNVDLIQMDILEIYLLKERFDIIECGGVLHHMNNPKKGLKELVNVLKPNGFMKLGLYSILGRQDVIKARKYIADQTFEANRISIQDFRNKILSGRLKKLNSLQTFIDFYSLSEFRDLCFHTQEHRFNIKQLKDTLESNQLKFLGFQLKEPIKSLYKKYFPEDKVQTNLDNWSKFEEQYPNTFRAMYQFWVCKTKF